MNIKYRNVAKTEISENIPVLATCQK